LAFAWWLSPPLDAGVGDPLWSEASNLIDALRFLCGEVTRVRSLSAGTGGLAVQLEFTQGTVGMLTCASLRRPERRIELELLGDGWSLQFGSWLTTLRLDENDRATILRCLNNPVAEQTATFLEAVARNDPSRVSVPYADALRTMAVCHAASQSAKENQPVALA
jgi:predicted dehydrogenase